MSHPLRSKIDEMVKNNKVMVFMKGTPQFPQCGFSARAVQTLKVAGLDPKEMGSFDVLSDEPMWEALEDYSQWPTVPQIFIKGEFIGGSDIVMEMQERGELADLLT